MILSVFGRINKGGGGGEGGFKSKASELRKKGFDSGAAFCLSWFSGRG